MDVHASRRASTGLALAALLACGDGDADLVDPGLAGSTGPASSEGAAPGRVPADVEPRVVPRSPATIDAETWCTALTPGEALASISPQGHAWLVTPGESTQALRVLDPFAETVSDVVELRLRRLGPAQAWTAEHGTVIADGELWRLDGPQRILLAPPDPLTKSASMCGDPSLSGHVLTAGRLFERRPDDVWWGWDPDLEAAQAMTSIVAQDGACTNADDVMWVVGKDGTLWRLDGDTAQRTAQFVMPVVAVTDGLLGVLDDAVLWTGAPAELAGATPLWQPWHFDRTAPAALSASDGALWMLAGDQLLRFDGDAWAEVRHDAAGDFEAVLAHPSGAWLVAPDALCHVRHQPMIRIEGIRPYVHGQQDEYEILIFAPDGELAEAFVDDQPAALGFDNDTGAYVGRVRLETTGWHTVRVVAGTQMRRIDIKRVGTPQRSWAADIAPLYDTHCTGGACHGGDEDNAPRALDAHETWVAYADKLRTRVVETETMPPPGAQAAWGPARIEVVEQWLDAGMQP